MFVDKAVVARVPSVSKLSKHVTTGDARCIHLNASKGLSYEPFIGNYVKTARYSCWNIVCLVCRCHPTLISA